MKNIYSSRKLKSLIFFVLTYNVNICFAHDFDWRPPVISEMDKYGQILNDEEGVKRYTDYLKSRHIKYTLDSEHPTVIWWYPYNEDHKNLIYKEAFDIPVNQESSAFKTEGKSKIFLEHLTRRGIESRLFNVDSEFVVIWHHNSDCS